MKAYKNINIFIAALVCILLMPVSSYALWGGKVRDDALLSGRAAMEDALYPLAQTHFERALKKSHRTDDEVEAATLLARSLRYQEKYELARAVLDEHQKKAPKSSVYANYLLERAFLDFSMGRYDEAVALINTPVEGESDDIRMERMLLLPKVYIKLGCSDDALEAFAVFHKEYTAAPGAASNLLAWAGALTKVNRLEDAIGKLRDIADLYPATRQAWTARIWEVQLLSRLGCWAEVKKMLDDLVADERSPVEIRAEAYFCLARVFEHDRDIDSAIEQLEKIETLGISGDALQQGRVFRGKLLFMSGREEEGMKLLREAMRSAPDVPQIEEAQLHIANMLLDQDRPEEALREFQYYLEAFDNPGGKARALLGKGWCLYLTDKFNEAAGVFEKAWNLLPEGELKEEAVYKAADSFFQAGMYNKALDLYTAGLKLDQDSEKKPQMRFQSAECLHRLNRNEEAENSLAELQRLFPKSRYAEKAAIKSAQIDESRHRWLAAADKYSAIIEKYADAESAIQALHSRGMIYYRLSRFDEAIRDFDKLIAEHDGIPLSQHAFFMRGWCFYLLGDEDKAMEICASFIEKYPHSVWSEDVHFWISNNYFNRGLYADAEKKFAAMASAYSNGKLPDAALFWAARSAVKQKEYTHAVEYLGKLIDEYPQSSKIYEARFSQGDALSAMGKFSEAILVFEEIVKNRKEDSAGGYFVMRAWGRMGDCNFTLGAEDPKRYNAAMRCYSHIMESQSSSVQLKLQAEFKIGRCLEKIRQTDKALEHYMNVVYEHLKYRKKGNIGDTLWFTKAAFRAAEIAESREEWRSALNIYQRVLDADVASATEAQKRIRQIRLDHWILF